MAGILSDLQAAPGLDAPASFQVLQQSGKERIEGPIGRHAAEMLLHMTSAANARDIVIMGRSLMFISTNASY
jgi:hypothetical protein